MRTNEELINRMRAEFLEMPGMHLSRQQVERLCGVEQGLCQTVLDALVDANFLRVCADGQYARVSDGGLSRDRSAKVLRVRRHDPHVRRGHSVDVPPS